MSGGGGPGHYGGRRRGVAGRHTSSHTSRHRDTPAPPWPSTCRRPTRSAPPGAPRQAARLAGRGARAVPAPTPRDFLAVATPGAGKTTFALRVATELLDRGVVSRITVVAPTEHLKRQWAEAAARVGIRLDPEVHEPQGAHGRDFDGVAVTYAQVAMQPDAAPGPHRAAPDPGDPRRDPPRRRCPVAGATRVREAFEPAARRLALTGTPFRSDTTRSRSWSTSAAPTASAARRPTTPTATAMPCRRRRPSRDLPGLLRQMRWRTKAGDEIAARLGEPMTKDMIAPGLAHGAGPARRVDPARCCAAADSA